MIIGEEPGGRNDPNYENETGHAPRQERDYPEDKWESVENHHPRSGSSEVSIIESNKLRPIFFKNISGYSAEPSSSKKYPYYTNTKNHRRLTEMILIHLINLFSGVCRT